MSHLAEMEPPYVTPFRYSEKTFFFPELNVQTCNSHFECFYFKIIVSLNGTINISIKSSSSSPVKYCDGIFFPFYQNDHLCIYWSAINS